MDSLFGLMGLGGRPADFAGFSNIAQRAASHREEVRILREKSPGSTWQGDSVALGMFPGGGSISPCRRPAPWRDSATGCTIVADARVHNRTELIEALLPSHPEAGEASDLQLILWAYLCWGAEFLPRLLGDYAVGIWDNRDQTLFCARDPTGACPLTYIRRNDYFAFASNPEWLLGLSGIHGRPDALQVAQYLVPSLPLPYTRHTWREGIDALLPGEWLRIGTGGRMQVIRWWAPPPVSEQKYACDVEVAEHYRAVFGEAVRCRAESGDRQSAVMMSGGIDSMSVAATLAEVSQHHAPLRTYSVVQDSSADCIESRSIHSINDSLGSAATLIAIPSYAGPVGMDDLVRIAWSSPHPVDNSLLIPSLLCLAAARAGEDGLLHGVAGDIVAGVRHPYFAGFIRAGAWKQAWRECRAASKNNVYLRGRKPFRMFCGAIADTCLPARLQLVRQRLVGYAKRTNALVPYLTPNLLNKDLLACLHHAAAFAPDPCEPQPICRDESSSAINFEALSSGMVGFGRIGRKFGVRMSDPWSDPRVVQFFRNLALEYKVRDGWTKYLVRQAFRDRVRAPVLWRRDKTHLGGQITQQLMLRTDAFVREVLNDGLPSIADYVDLKVARAVSEDYDPLERDEVMQRAFELVTLILWSRQRN